MTQAMTLLLAGAMTTLLAAAPAALAQGTGPGTCGKGKVWSPEKNKCVPKPKGSGSGSWSGLTAGPDRGLE